MCANTEPVLVAAISDLDHAPTHAPTRRKHNHNNDNTLPRRPFLPSPNNHAHHALSTATLDNVPPALLCLGVVGAGVAHALLQEQLVHKMPSRMPLVLTAYEFGVCSALSATYLAIYGWNGPPPRPLPILRVSALVCASLVSGNIALRWVSYPVKVIIKSCKLLPTMALGALLLGKRYSVWDHVCAVLLCCGLVGFTLADATEAADASSSDAATSGTSLLGVALLLLAVCCDAVQVLLQERLLRDEPHYTPMHVMVQTNGLGLLAVLAALVASGGSADVASDSLPWMRLVLYGATSWFGVSCFLALARTFGGTAAVVASNSRKLFSIVLSFLVFPKPCSSMQLVSGLSVLSGVSIHVYRKNVARLPSSAAPAPATQRAAARPRRRRSLKGE